MIKKPKKPTEKEREESKIDHHWQPWRWITDDGTVVGASEQMDAEVVRMTTRTLQRAMAKRWQIFLPPPMKKEEG